MKGGFMPALTMRAVARHSKPARVRLERILVDVFIWL